MSTTHPFDYEQGEETQDGFDIGGRFSYEKLNAVAVMNVVPNLALDFKFDVNAAGMTVMEE